MLDMLADYNLDGFFLDGPTYFPRACYCAACRRLFSQSHGSEAPAWADRQAPKWPAFVDFRAKPLARFLQDLRTAVKARKSDAVLYMNNASLGPTWRGSRDTRVLAPALDLLGNERANFRASGAGAPPGHSGAANPFWMPGAATRILESQALTQELHVPRKSTALLARDSG